MKVIKEIGSKRIIIIIIVSNLRLLLFADVFLEIDSDDNDWKFLDFFFFFRDNEEGMVFLFSEVLY